MATETTNTLSTEAKQFYETILLARAQPNLIHAQGAQMRPLPPNRGKSAEWRRYGVLSAATTALTEGTAPSDTQMTITTVTASLQQYGAYHQYSDVLEMLAIDPYLAEVAEIFGDQAGLTVDTLVRNAITAGTTVRYVSGLGSRGAVTSSDIINSTEIRMAVRDLKVQNARPWKRNSYGAFVHPDTKYDMFSDANIVNAFERAYPRGADNPSVNGEIGEYAGVIFMESSQARVFTSLGATGVDVYGTVFFGADAYGIVELEGGSLEVIVHPPGSAGAAVPLDQYGTIGWKMLFDVVRLNENWLYRLEHGATP